ncbi:MAG: heme A synthase [Nitrospinae bacterium]|nr:heme A synthase [Nitrospinota bacterium]
MNNNVATGYSGKDKLVLGLAIAFTYILMIFGNVVTTTGSGMACPDWPLCYGTVNPPKAISVWIEWGHRLIGGVTGFLILAAAFLTWKKAGPAIRFFLKVAVVTIVAAILLGGAIIIVDAPLLDSFKRIAVVSSHIISSTIIFATLIIAYHSVSSRAAEAADRFYIFLFVLTFAQIVIGIVVRYANASMACPDWPLCQGSILPPSFSFEVLLHYTHRLIAYVIFGVTLWKFTAARKAGAPARRDAITFGLVLLQASIGIGIVQTVMFLPLLVMHGAAGFALLGWTAWLGAPGMTGARAAEK